ncbi:MAG: hypothetical protein E4H14_17930 [Candidatus Thorarchaeota archaeon]|nr:MAG: hypothetical protein E4H14_17930 [Candidatus Thorarchaeota archaeon]
MKGSKNSAILYLLSAISLIVQAGISSIIFGEWLGAFIGGAIALIMLMGMLMAYTGELSAVVHTTVVDRPTYVGDTIERTTTTTDTGGRTQNAPCCGIGGGIMIIIVLVIASEGLGMEYLILLTPGVVGAILAFLAAIVFMIEYKGPWTGRAF